MSKAITIDTAAKLVACKNNHDSYFAPQNKYGYKISINHPKIKPLYEAFKKKKKAIILSDEERFEFEAIIFKMIERNRNNDK